MPDPALGAIARAWGRIGCLGFGGPPAHMTMLRRLCVDDRGWLTAEDFEHGLTAANLLPGPSSTQLAIWTAWRVGGRPGAVVGGLAFILPGLLLILGLAALLLGDPPLAVRELAAGAGAAVAAVAVHAAVELAGPSWRRALHRARWALYAAAGVVCTALLGPWLVLVVIACGLIELAVPAMVLIPATVAVGGTWALAWTSLKVGALSYGAGFVVIPLMQHDAVDRFHWLTSGEFTSAVALGQLTPGPVLHTVAVVGYGAHGLGGALLAALIAFAPSFLFVLAGGNGFERLIRDERARTFMAGAGPAAIGGILGSAVPLAAAIAEPWQAAVLAGAAVLLLVLRRGVVPTLGLAAAAGLVAALLGAPIPA